MTWAFWSLSTRLYDFFLRAACAPLRALLAPFFLRATCAPLRALLARVFAWLLEDVERFDGGAGTGDDEAVSEAGMADLDLAPAPVTDPGGPPSHRLPRQTTPISE